MAEFMDIQAALYSRMEFLAEEIEDYGLISEAVTETEDYGSIAVAVTSSEDYGSLATDTEIAWPNYTFDDSGEFVRPTFLPGDTEQAGMGADGLDVTDGLFQVDIYTPRGKGRSQLVDSIGDLYKRGTVLTYGSASVRVRGPSLGASRFEGDWFVTPIRINWQVYTEAR